MRQHSIYICQQCGYQSSSWLGKCPECEGWNSLVETIIDSKAEVRNKIDIEKIVLPLSQVDSFKKKRLSTGISEFDRVLGGDEVSSGLVPGSVVLVAGEPGIGKSTLLLQLAISIASKISRNKSKIDNNGFVVYVAGEESPQQIKARAERLTVNQAIPKNLLILAETDLGTIQPTVEKICPSLLIVDSIQTMTVSGLSGIAGSIGQVREVTARLHKIAKKLNIPIILVGHVTKEGAIAGPKVVEHLVDVVLYLEGDQFHTYRLLRGVKNRFGSVFEVGVFEMGEGGLLSVENPSQFFLQARRVNQPGSVVTPVLSGARAILTEIQALTSPINFGIARRVGNGIDFNRLQMILAILSRRLKLSLNEVDIFVNAAGGLKVIEPAADLAIVLAIISALKNKLISPKVAAVGEVGLLGEIRPVSLQKQRISEAKKMGFSQIIAPTEFRSIDEAVKFLF